MKKIVFNLMSLMLCGFMAQAQVNGTVSGTVLDAQQQPVQGVAVFFLGSHTTWNNSMTPSIAYQHAYTDGNGEYSISYYGVMMNDSAVIGVMDCNKNVEARAIQIHSGATNPINHNIQISCVPDECDAFVTLDSMSLAPSYIFVAVSLRDSAYAIQGPATSPIIHEWEIDNAIYTSAAYYPNFDTVMISQANLPNTFQYCYQRTALCAATCETKGNFIPPTTCNADFYVDTVNSINFQGQVVIWENSTTDTGATIIGYRWDFGDGNTSNVQYPTHTYSDTGIYNVCLTIVSVDGTDTCTSTFCDSIGFDAQGNLVYKKSQQGFTINVIDPATVGQQENALQNGIDLYPNPSNGEAVLTWDPALAVQQVDVMSISGELVQTIEPHTSSVEFGRLTSGVYIVRIQSKEGVTSRRMIVQ